MEPVAPEVARVRQRHPPPLHAEHTQAHHHHTGRQRTVTICVTRLRCPHTRTHTHTHAHTQHTHAHTHKQHTHMHAHSHVVGDGTGYRPCFVNLQHMKGRGGVIVNTASIGGLFVIPFSPVYAATKAAVVHFTRSLGYLGQADNIRITAICPGFAVCASHAPVSLAHRQCSRLVPRPWERFGVTCRLPAQTSHPHSH